MVGVHWWVRSKCGTKTRLTWKNLLPKIHLGYIVLSPCHEQFVVEDEIFLVRLYHWRPRQPSAEMRKCKIGKEKVQNVDISHLYILQRVNYSKVICL